MQLYTQFIILIAIILVLISLSNIFNTCKYTSSNLTSVSTESITRDVNTSGVHSWNSFVKLYLKFNKSCGNPQNNMIMQRYDDTNLNLEVYREWSLNSRLIHKMLQIDFETNKIENIDKRECQSSKEVANAISYPVSQQPCRIPWLSNEVICDTMYKYSNILFIGDSLTRHSYQSLFMLLRDDLRYGGYDNDRETLIYDNCSCDGQFSESLICRNGLEGTKAGRYQREPYLSLFNSSVKDLRYKGVCSSSYETNHTVRFDYMKPEEPLPVDPSMTCDNNDRLFFIYLQGNISK